MNQKSRYAFRIVLGGWLAYIGCSLLYQMYSERPSNMVLISLIAVVFVIIGAICVIHSLKQVFDFWKGQMPEPAEDEEKPEAEEVKNKVRRNKVQTVALTYTENEQKEEPNAVSGQKEEQKAEEQKAEKNQSSVRRETEEAQEAEEGESAEENRTAEAVPESVPEQHPETEQPAEETADRDIEILEISEEETDNHADEIESDYEEK